MSDASDVTFPSCTAASSTIVGVVAGPYPDEETCGQCMPRGVFGVAPASDPRYLGGFVDARGVRHDGLVHEDDCPSLRPTAPGPPHSCDTLRLEVKDCPTADPGDRVRLLVNGRRVTVTRFVEELKQARVRATALQIVTGEEVPEEAGR